MCGALMSDKERIEFSQEIAIFVTTFATEVKELRQSINRRDLPIKSRTQHQDEVVSYLLEVSIS